MTATLSSRACVVLVCVCAPSAQAQWIYETVDLMNSRASCGMGLAGDGTPILLFSGPTDGFSCDGTADVYVKVRFGPGNWVEPPAVYSPSRLRVTRPAMAVDPPGNIYVAFELRWAYYTGIIKFRRTGPTTWVRDDGYVLISAPTPVACGQDDPNLGPPYVYGYNPRIGVSTTGGIYVSANRAGNSDCVIAYNNGADWRTGWSVALVRTSANVTGLAPDANGDMHAALVSTNADPNLADSVYVKFHDGRVVVGPTVIGDGGARTGDCAISAGNSTYIAAPEWNYGGNGVWSGYSWRINGTLIDPPVNISGSPSGLCCTGVAASAGWVRYYWRQEVADARWGWFLGHVGFPPERISRTGHDVAQMDIKMDAGGNLHAGILDFDPTSGAFYSYAYRANDEPAPGGPQGTIVGIVHDQNGAPVANATVTVQTTAVTTTRTDGTYSVMVPVGTYSVTAAKTFYLSQTLTAVAVSENQITDAGFTITGQPPAPVTSFVANPRDRAVYLQWQNPASANFSGVVVRSRMDGFPTSPTDGTLVVDQPDAPGGVRGFTHSGLQGGRAYYYTIFPYYADASRFWATGTGTSATPIVAADLDDDGDVDLSDFSVFQLCFNGPNRPPAPYTDCAAADIDDDGDADLTDFAIFQACFNGPNRPAACT